MGIYYTDTLKVEQNHWADIAGDSLIYTEGLGPCIGVGIAWKKWAAILHSANIDLDEHDEIAGMLSKAKEVIPPSIIPHIRPILCGGDCYDDFDDPNEAEEFERRVRKARKLIEQILTNAGFGKPCMRWNEANQTAALVADLVRGTMTIEVNHRAVQTWPISKRNR